MHVLGNTRKTTAVCTTSLLVSLRCSQSWTALGHTPGYLFDAWPKQFFVVVPQVWGAVHGQMIRVEWRGVELPAILSGEFFYSVPFNSRRNPGSCLMCSSRARAVAELALPAMGGVTHLKFAPNGRLLFSGSRKDATIVCWDIRRTKEVGEILRLECASRQHCCCQGN